MNSLIFYSGIMAVFAVVDAFIPGFGSTSLDMGIAMVMLGFGLAIRNGGKI